MGYKPSEEARLHKLNNTKLSTLKDLDLPALKGILKEWARVGNMRAARVRKVDPLYSHLHEYKKGGRYGKKGSYRDKETILNELRRIKVESSHLNKKEALQEKKEVQAFRDKIMTLPEFEEEAMIDEEKFRKGFAMYRDHYTSVAIDVYDKVKQLVLKATDRDLYGVYYLIIRYVDEVEAQEREEKFEETFGYKESEDTPY